MVALLRLPPGSLVLEPCAGRGHFLPPLLDAGYQVHALEVSADSVDYLSKSYGKRVVVQHGDFLRLSMPDLLTSSGLFPGTFDGVVANPPYGMYLEPSARKSFRDALGGFYSRETYALFLRLAGDLLRKGGRLVFITPDTFLTSNLHKGLRKYLFTQFHDVEFTSFPSDFFPGVNYGYGKMCITAATKGAPATNQTVRLCSLESSDGVESLRDAKACRTRATVVPISSILATDDFQVVSTERFLGGDYHSWPTLGELADCRTGIYSGDNQRFHRYQKELLKVRGVGQPLDWSKVRSGKSLTEQERMCGVSGPQHYVPLAKGGHKPLMMPETWAIDWSVDAVNYYRTDAKARFQNSEFYFRRGLAVPMVTSGRCTSSAILAIFAA